MTESEFERLAGAALTALESAFERAATGERARELAVVLLERRARVDVAGRAEALRDILERHQFGAQRAIAVRECHAPAYFFVWLGSSASAG